MAEREIRIGDTSSFRYIGIKPPISEITTSTIMKTIRLPLWIVTGMHDSYTQDPTGVTPENQYTEFGYDVGHIEDIFGRSHVNNVAIVLAYQIAKILERQGDTVKVNPDIVPTDFRTPIFSMEADRIRKVKHMITAHKEQ